MFISPRFIPFLTLLLIWSGFTWVWQGVVFCDSMSPSGCIIGCSSEWALLLFWPLHFVAGFHVSIISSILFHCLHLRRIFVFHNGTLHCSEFFGFLTWVSSGTLFPLNSILLYSVRLFRKKRYCSAIWFYDFTIFILSSLLFGVFGFGNIGFYNTRTVARQGPDMGRFLSIIYGRFRPSSYLFDLSLVGHWGKRSCLSTRRVMWHDLLRVDLLTLKSVSFKCHKHQCF